MSRASGRRSSADSCSGTYALSAGYRDAYYIKAQKVRTLIKADFDAAFESVDALVAPTSPTVAFRIGANLDDPVAMYALDACTLPVSVAGLPGLTLPAGLSEGLPVGLQLIGKAWDEAGLLRLGRAYEAITASAAWRRQEPTDLAARSRAGSARTEAAERVGLRAATLRPSRRRQAGAPAMPAPPIRRHRLGSRPDPFAPTLGRLARVRSRPQGQCDQPARHRGAS